MLGGLAVTAGLAVHFWRRARRRERELAVAREHYRHLFEEPAMAIIEEDFSTVVRRLAGLRGAGVTDLRGHLQAQPELAAELFRGVRILNANRHAQRLVGAVDLADYRTRMQALTAKRAPQAFVGQLVALWEGRRQEIVPATFKSGAGRVHTGALQWALVDEPEARGGREVRALITFTDLSALRDSEERYRQLFESALEGIYESSPQGGFNRVNPAMADIFGFASAQEMTDLPAEAVQALYVEPQRRREFYARIGASGTLQDFESQVRRKDGRVIWIAENARVVRDSRGTATHYQGFITDITARKKAERAWRESEERWRLAVRGGGAGIWENDFITRESFYSDRSKEILGFAPHEISNRREDWTGRIHPDDAHLGVQAMRDHLEGRSAYYKVEHRFLAKDGSYRWIASHAQALVDAQGRPTRIVGTHLDVTERRKAEEQLRASEARYRMLFEHAPFGIVEFDFGPDKAWLEQRRAEGVADLPGYLATQEGALDRTSGPLRLTGLNAAAIKLVGGRSGEEVTANLPRLMTPEFEQARREFYLTVWAGGREHEAEMTINALDGSPRKLHSRWWIPLADGQPNYSQAQLALVDLTHLKSTEQALEQEQERLRVTLRAMAEGVVTVDTRGVVRFINEAACGLLGRTEEEVVGRMFGKICVLLHGHSRSPLPSPPAAAQAGDRSLDLPRPTVLLRRDGGEVQVDGCCAPMHEHAGAVVGAVLVMRDVSERSRLEAELQRANKIESVGLLAGGIAHDFNNILAVVMGNVTLAMMDETVKGSRAARWLAEAEKATLRARGLTQQLLTFSKGGEPVRASVQLPELVREAAEFALHGANARCEFTIAENLWPAEADKGQIGQVVQNLVLNAVQAMPGGGVITIGLRNVQLDAHARPPLAAGRYLKLSIRDQGEGIAREHLARMFEPYFTTKPQGFGLGLATAYSIVRKHQGHIVVESEVGRGTVFDIWLPAAVSAPPSAAGSHAPFEQLQGRVLFMDDEEPIRQMAVLLLARIGMETVTAEEGAEAVRLFAEAKAGGTPFDVVVMDLTVPGGMGGREAMERILGIDPAVRAIVSSGYSSDPVMANFRAHGFCGMVAKPYRVADLIKALRVALRR
jgi:PAS domain S-box-containing protein